MLNDLIVWGSELGRELQMFLEMTCYVLLYGVVYFFSKGALLSFVKSVVTKTENTWDDIFLNRHVFDRLAHLPSFYVMHETLPVFVKDFGRLSIWVERIIQVMMIVVIVRVLSAAISAFIEIFKHIPALERQPLTSYGQILKIGLFGFSGIIIVATLIGKSPWVLLSGLGALTAILLVLFKDILMGLVASIQVSSNDIVRVGDWIEMPKYGVDGTVFDMSLNSIKVRNFDQTISTIPTYALISESVRNWRGVFDKGARRIKRALYFDMNSVQFCTESCLHRYSQDPLLSMESLDMSIGAIDGENTEDEGVDSFSKLTNLSVFRRYVQAFLRQNENLHQDGFTFLVRQLSPCSEGVGLEIYVFTKTTEWVEYEKIQADIFEHLIAKVSDFDLRIFQNPSEMMFVSSTLNS